jgi:hypothetical protein
MNFGTINDWKGLLAIIGVATIIAAVTGPLLIPLRYLPPGQSSVLTVSLPAPSGLACILCRGPDLIDISYPASMRVNQSATVAVKLFPEAHPTSRLVHNNRLQKPLQATLAGAAFTVTPASELTNSAGTALPALWRWSISPVEKKQGSQELVLYLDDIALAVMGDDPSADLSFVKSVNGFPTWPVSYASLKSEVLKVYVFTEEGLPVDLYFIIRYGVGVIGFVLLYPLFVDRLKEWLETKRARRASPRRQEPK